MYVVPFITSVSPTVAFAHLQIAPSKAIVREFVLFEVVLLEVVLLEVVLLEVVLLEVVLLEVVLLEVVLLEVELLCESFPDTGHVPQTGLLASARAELESTKPEGSDEIFSTHQSVRS